MDFTNIDSDIYGDAEDDDELMAELLALENEERRKTPAKQPSKPPSTTKKPLMSQPDDNFDDFDDEDLEGDEDLQSELSKLVDENLPSSSGPPPIPPPPVRAAPLPPIPPRRDISLDQQPETANKTESNIASTSNIKPAISNNEMLSAPVSHVQKSQSATSVSAAASTNHVNDAPSIKIKKILIKRRDAFMDNAKAAKEADDKDNAVEFLSMVKMFNQAIIESKDVDLTEADLNEVPKTPPPYRKKAEPTTLLEDLEARMLKYQELVDKYKQTGEEQRARMNVRMVGAYKDAIGTLKKGRAIDVTILPVPPGFQPLTPNSYSTPQTISHAENNVEKSAPISKPLVVNSEQQNQLKFLLTRQLQYKQAAVDAKKRGDLETAKQMLLNSKKIDPMIEASRGGLPVKISDVPMAPQAHVQSGFVQPTMNRANPNNASLLEKELIKQINQCDQLRQLFIKLSDSKSVLFLETLLNETKKDLLYFRQCIKNGQMPKYAIIEQSLPSIEKHTEIPDDVLQLKVLSINKIKLPDGWKPKDCSIYVTYDFPFPSEKHQTGRTQTVLGTDNPEYGDAFQLSINRKAVRFNTMIKKRSIKLEIYQKGSFLRSDKLWGSAEMPLVELEKYASINKTIDIMEGRKKTGGTISVEICISQPVGDNKGTQTVKKKWVKIQR